MLYRHVSDHYRANFDQFVNSGLAAELIERELLIGHEEVDPAGIPGAPYKVLRPTPIRFVSYPYEWSFGQLRDAALLTLQIQEVAIKHGMSLKDASAYNIQFRGAKPILIDTLSFEVRRAGRPWVAYRQFCQHFLAPLALMSWRDVRLGQLFRVHIDGVPLDLASKLLPRATWFRPSLLAHLHLHARAQQKYAAKPTPDTIQRSMSETASKGVLDSLRAAVTSLKWRPAGTEWVDYYGETNYTDAAMAEKEKLVGEYIDACHPRIVWDLGANTGRFSRLASQRLIDTIALDVDPAAVEKNYRAAGAAEDRHLLPLIVDLANPSGGIGWAGTERLSLEQRGPADLVLALALIHHLAIGNNLPFGNIADWFSRIARNLVIEFVPKTDSQVARMLASRDDIFDQYHQDAFEAAFMAFFEITARHGISGTGRVLYLMTRRRAEQGD